jgi:DNA repair protein RadD
MTLKLQLPPSEDPALTPRPYQMEAIDAVELHLSTRETNPCVVIPTGGGKSFVIAMQIQRWKLDYPPLRVCILAHRKELVDQNSKELLGLWPAADVGIFSAGLRKRDTDNSIVYASIDSIWNKGNEFAPFDVIIIDEAHRIPARGEGKYRTFIKACQRWNNALRVIGYTATPFRMEGPICHKDHILQEVCYEVSVAHLISQGYVSPLRSRESDVRPDVSQVKKNNNGEYIEKELAKAVDRADLIADTVREMMARVREEKRKSVIVFCVDVIHCQHISAELRKYGVNAPYITAKTPPSERDRIVEEFKKQKIQILLNVNVYTEGFNAKCVDCVVLLRPTLSKALYIQMVGRGLRLWPGKEYCRILDFAGCIAEHGPIDQLDVGLVRLAKCSGCGDTFSRAIRVCPACGWEIPPRLMEEMERADRERERALHSSKVSNESIVTEPVWLDVDDVSIHLHRKPDKPDSLRVQYRCGLTMVSEWVCLDHTGYARQKAGQWWMLRDLPGDFAKVTVADAMADMFLPQLIKERTRRIEVIRRGKFYEILSYDLTLRNTDTYIS